MEYLMTYGWSILIIAVILGALAYLGVFNPIYFAPKANPGSCQVFRPNGAGTSYDVNLLGVCNGEMFQYTGQFSSTKNAYVETNLENVQISWTLYAWFKAGFLSNGWVGPNCGLPGSLIVDSDYPGQGGTGMGVNSLYIGYIYNGGSGTIPYNFQTNRWYQISVVFDRQSSTITGYVNGVKAAPSIPVTFATATNIKPFYMGGIPPGAGTCAYALDGYISNVQIYNSSLGPNTISAMYAEGIGGAPIDLQNLVGWWPLNGNANDYSGNGNDGTPVNVIFTTNWYNGYSQP